LSASAALPDPFAIEPMAFTSQAIRAAAIRVPGSKSLSNRHLILAALARGSTRLRGLLACDDCDRLLAALDACAISHRVDGGDLIIDGGADRSERDTTVNLGDGGTPTRFMLAFAAAQRGGACIIDASARMRERPVAEGVAMLRALGGEIHAEIHAETHAENHADTHGVGDPMHLLMRLPMRVRGGSLRGGRIDIGATASSQFVSALMLVAPALADGIDIHFTDEPTSASYLELSLAALAAAGVNFEVVRRPVLLSAASVGGGLARITIPSQPIVGGTIDIEPDASSAVYPAAAAVLCGSSVTLEGLARHSAQPDIGFLDDLAMRGARVEVVGNSTRVSAGKSLRGHDANYARMPDAAVMAMVLAACADGPSLFTGLATLRVKESDRIAAVATGLRALGATVETGDDWARIHPLPARNSAIKVAIDTVNDHRIAMAFAILGLARGGVSIANPGCVGKSWPGFWTSLDLLRSGT
jgi:3-phosphoshikimate 1-carboxyvinyltransferase